MYLEKLFLPLFSLFFLFPVVGFAQKMPDSVALQTVVIQATRASDRSPVPHTNMRASDLQKQYHAQDVPMLLTSVPSLVETSDAGIGTGYTGMRIRGSDPTRINVTINGIPLNDAESQAVYWVNLPDLASSATEVQVQRGVGSSTNGAGAFGATVNIDISKVNAEPYAVLSSTAGSFRTQRQSVQLGTGLLRQRFAFTGRVSTVGSDGYIDRARADLQSLHLSGAYVGTRSVLQAHLLRGKEITYQAWNGVPAQYIADAVLRRYNTAGTQKPGEPYRDEVDNYRQTHYLVHYKLNLAQGLDLQLNGHYTQGQGYYELYRAGRKFSALKMPLPKDASIKKTDAVLRRWLDNDFYGSTFALRWSPSVNPPFFQRTPVFLLGGASNRYTGAHFGEVIWAQYATVPNNHRYYDNDARKDDANVYFKSEFFWRRGIATFLDLQMRRVAYNFQGFDVRSDEVLDTVQQRAVLRFFNPKMGFSWKINPRWSMYGFLGIGNREPNRDDFVQSTLASRPKPERLYNAEAGVRTGGDQWRMQANFFYMYYRNQLVLDGRINDVGAYIRTNVARSYRAGIEWEGEWHPTQTFTLSSNLALSRNRVLDFSEYLDNWDTGTQDVNHYKQTDLAFSPNVIGRLAADWRFWQRGRHQWTVNLSGKYVGRQFLDNTGNANTTLHDYLVSDARMGYDWKTRTGDSRLAVFFTVHNLLNARYANNGWTYRYRSAGYDARPDDPYTRLETGDVYNQTGFFPQALRHWMATAVVRF